MHERLAALWQRDGDQRGKPRPVEAITGQFDLAEELAFVWADLNAERTLLEIEKQKSAALIRVMHDDMKERDGRLATTLAELGTAATSSARWMSLDAVRFSSTTWSATKRRSCS